MRIRKKILIVDDDLDLCQILETVLGSMGYETVMAVNGQEAVELAMSQQPDLILMDLMLPVMDGLQATTLIKNNSSTQSIAILAMTARSTPEDRKKCFLCGCDDFIAKPFTVKELIACIEKALTQFAGSLDATPPQPLSVASKMLS